jgi:hypothetical protein
LRLAGECCVKKASLCRVSASRDRDEPPPESDEATTPGDMSIDPFARTRGRFHAAMPRYRNGQTARPRLPRARFCPDT